MNVKTEHMKIITYVFTAEEKDYLIEAGIWSLLMARMLECERVEIE
jgi:hypothetical protein